jgi:hypothetical protein
VFEMGDSSRTWRSWTPLRFFHAVGERKAVSGCSLRRIADFGEVAGLQRVKDGRGNRLGGALSFLGAGLLGGGGAAITAMWMIRMLPVASVSIRQL